MLSSSKFRFLAHLWIENAREYLRKLKKGDAISTRNTIDNTALSRTWKDMEPGWTPRLDN